MAFSFAKVLQQELDEFVTEWNGHRIRYNRRADCPAGIYQMTSLICQNVLVRVVDLNYARDIPTRNLITVYSC